MRIIDADKLYPDCMTKDGKLAISQSQLANAPTVEAFTKEDMSGAYNEGYACGSRESERPKGEWRVRHDNHFRCTNCEQYSSFNFNYCPNCGADMRGDKNG